LSFALTWKYQVSAVKLV
jgi:hypothetical protein